MQFPGFAAACLVALVASPSAVSEDAASRTVLSPNGRTTLTFTVADGAAAYSVVREGTLLIEASRLGPEVAEEGFEGWEVVSSRTGAHASSWRPVHGERSRVRDSYRFLTVQLKSRSPSARRLDLDFRAYDAGVAFCWSIPAQEGLEKVRVTEEHSEFRFPDDHRAWAVYSAQGVYAETTISGITEGCERPLVLEGAAATYLAIGEARLVDFARMKLSPLAGVEHALVSDLDGPATCPLPFRSPWRFVMFADFPEELLENNDLVLNLNDPCEIEDPSWIRPGKVLREVTLTTAGGRACVDFAAAHGIEYVEFDAGWYGNEYDDASDATTVTVDPKRSPGPLDLQGVIEYAKERGVGIILYVNRRALEKQLDEVLALFEQWGVAGVKYGFVNVGSQRWTTWLHEAVRKAAAHRLMVDVHDEYRPTGYSRTYPNLMTQEGISGDETSPTNTQTLTVLFTRMIAGAGDMTACYYDERVARNASHAYQLARVIAIHSPWQFVFWYDRPPASPRAKGGAGGAKNVIGDEPELEFFAHLPASWDDTIALDGEIGEHATIARRSGADWYVGCLNGAAARSFHVPLAFLDQGTPYTASIYLDDPEVDTRTHVRIERREVDAKTTLEFELPANGGRAIRLVPRH